MLTMTRLWGILALALALPAFGTVAHTASADEGKHHHHHHHGKGDHHHKHHHKHDKVEPSQKEDKSVATAKAQPIVATKPQPLVHAAVQAAKVVTTETSIVDKMKLLEAKLAQKAKAQKTATAHGHIMVNGPLPAEFNERFSSAVAAATGADAKTVKVTDSTPVQGNSDVVEVSFEAAPKVVKSVETGAADPDSKLAQGNLHSFLVAKDETEKKDEEEKGEKEEKEEKEEVQEMSKEEHEATPVEEKGIDIDTSMPYGDLEPFGREDTAQELTESSVKESDGMVDQLERAEVAEEKRSVFRALTRLRGAAITSFDGVARSQTGNIDEYNKIHKWRKTHPLHHLADEESDISKWAFPDNADF